LLYAWHNKTDVKDHARLLPIMMGFAHKELEAVDVIFDATESLNLEGALVDSQGRTAITTSSYEARKFGVKTGMAKWEALRVCPQLIFVVGDKGELSCGSLVSLDLDTRELLVQKNIE
jgi:uncharacterized protein YunC (DUF1805 family)